MSMELWCHAASSAHTHLTGVRASELLCSGSGVLWTWDPMIVETWIEMLREKLKCISSSFRLGASINAFFEAWTSSVHPLVGYVIVRVSQHT
jgi:hypothetical protein